MRDEKKKYSTLVFIGRFQPFHIGHQTVIDTALKEALEVIVLVGSSFTSRSLRNPFTFKEREQMIKSVYPQDQVIVKPIRDYPYDDNKWIAAVQDTVEKNLYLGDQWEGSPRVGLVGYEKDKSSYYLKLFPTWGSVAVNDHTGISATPIREDIFKRKTVSLRDTDTGRKLSCSPPVLSIIINLIKGEPSSQLQELFGEYDVINDYKESWKSAPYPPTFITTDVVVVQSGHVLLVKRKHSPGKNLLALPGGFLDQEETLLDGALRELKEETKLKVPLPVLRGSLKSSHTFDYPYRSDRGRTITTAFYINLGNDVELPKIRAKSNAHADLKHHFKSAPNQSPPKECVRCNTAVVDDVNDAVYAVWVPFSKIKSEMLFEDHYSIIDYFINIG